MQVKITNEEAFYKLPLSDLNVIADIASKHPDVPYMEQVFNICTTRAVQLIRDLFIPVTKQWQFKTKTNPAWTNCTDEMYEQIKHLARYEFQQIEI